MKNSDRYEPTPGNLLEPGAFIIGCNYWASHSGLYMFQDWRPEVIEEDFKKMAEIKLQMVRIFPLWSDFQPISVLKGQNAARVAYAWKGNQPLPADGSTVDPVMLERFRFVCDCAHKHNIKVLVSLVSGWMSGELFMPPVVQDVNLFTDPDAIYYEIRLIKEVIHALKDHPAITVWEPGNECNNLGVCAGRKEARMWMEVITTAIREADPTRPVAAGMHGIIAAANEACSPVGWPWIAPDLGRCCDLLTTHPYPAFTYHAGIDGLGSFRSAFHAAAESRFYADTSGRPCFAEELGSLAPIIASEKTAAEYLKTTLANLYIHDCRGMLWWCTFDQQHLPHPPYTWCAVERQLGLFHVDRSLKPVAETVKAFQEKVAALPFKNLPAMQKEALVILTSSGESWASAWGAFLLAKKAGFDVEFCYSSGVLPEKELYIVPSVATIEGVSYELHKALMEKVQRGATVLITYDNAMMAPFDSELGVESLGRDDCEQTVLVELGGNLLDFHLRSRLILDAVDSEVLLRDTDGRIVFTRKRADKGEIFFCALPVEKECITHTGKVDGNYFEFYRIAAKEICDARPLRSTDEMVTVTIHPTGDGKVIAAIVNNSSRDVQKPVELHKDWLTVGELPFEIPAREMLFVELKRK